MARKEVGGARRQSSVLRAHFTDMDRYAELFPETRLDVAQMAAGPLDGEALIVSAPTSIVARLRLDKLMVGNVSLDPGLVVFMVPLRWSGDYFFNGHATDPNEFFIETEGGYITKGQERDTVALGLRRSDVITTIASLRGIDPDEVDLGNGPLTISIEAMQRLKARLDHLTTLAAGISDCAAQDRLPAIADQITETILESYLNARHDALAASRVRSASRIVRRAEERFMESPELPVSLADLCQAAGVSATTLAKAFAQVCNETPLRYFKLRRLSRARSRLLNMPAAHSRVKFAALSCGFTELGRFSVEYRQLFGEQPSATLAQTSKLTIL